jgi:hypothetical protein
VGWRIVLNRKEKKKGKKFGCEQAECTQEKSRKKEAERNLAVGWRNVPNGRITYFHILNN